MRRLIGGLAAAAALAGLIVVFAHVIRGSSPDRQGEMPVAETSDAAPRSRPVEKAGRVSRDVTPPGMLHPPAGGELRHAIAHRPALLAARVRRPLPGVGDWIVRNGWAKALPDGSYGDAEAEARLARRGIWR